METLFSSLGRFAVRYKYLVAAAWIVITFAAVALCPGLASVTKDQNSNFLPAGAPSMKAATLAAPFQNIDYVSGNIIAARDTAALPAARPSGGSSSGGGAGLTLADQAAIHRLALAVKQMPHVVKVQEQGVATDGRAGQIAIQARVDRSGSGASKTLAEAIRSEFKSVGAPTGLSFHLAGELGVMVDIADASSNSRSMTTYLSIALIIVLLLIAFRALLAPLITLLPAALVLALSGPVIAASTHIGVQVGTITQMILIVLILGAGTDYGLFLVFRVREELRHGRTVSDAVTRALTNVGETISFSAFTVMVAMMSLLLSQFGFYQGLGPALAIAIGLMLLAGLTFLPALLAIFGRAVFWPSRTGAMGGEKPGIWGRVATRSVRQPLITLAALGAFLLIMASGIINTNTTGWGDSYVGPAGSDSAAAQVELDKHYPETSAGIYATLVLFQFQQPIWNHVQSLGTIQNELSANKMFLRVGGPLPINPHTGKLMVTPAQLLQWHTLLGPVQQLKPVEPAGLALPAAAYNAYLSTIAYISEDGRTVQWITQLKDNNSSSAHDINQVPALRAAMDQVGRDAGATQVGVFGDLSFTYDVGDLSNADLHRILPFVAVLIAILLAVVLRSLVAPLYLVVSVFLSYLAAMGFSAIAFVRFGGQSGLNFVLPFMMFIFLTALGSDYNILVMTRIREETHKRSLRQAVPYAVGVSGSTITSAGTILAGSFAVLALAAGNTSGADQMRQLGLGIAAGVLMDTFLIRSLLVPAVVTLLGRWNWFPSALYHQSADVEPEEMRGVA